MGLPKQFWNVSLEGVPVDSRAQVGQMLTKTPRMREKGANLVVFGEPGVGKSSVAALFAKSFRSNRFPTSWSSVWQLRENIKEKDRFGGEISMMERIRTVDVLVIDDLQSDAHDGWFSLSDFTNTIRSRHANMQPTIITTRLPRAELMQHPVLHALYERLLQINVKGENLRNANHVNFVKGFE